MLASELDARVLLPFHPARMRRRVAREADAADAVVPAEAEARVLALARAAPRAVAAALEQGVIRKDETFFCHNGRWQYTPQHSIRDTKRSEYLTVTEVLATSSNICTTKIYERLGKEALHRWAKKFHLGRRPQVQLPGAAKGLLADWEKWSDIQAANISFGQGMSASPLQVAAAFATLANGGLYNEPTLVTQITNAAGEPVWTHAPERERIVSESTSRSDVPATSPALASPAARSAALGALSAWASVPAAEAVTVAILAETPVFVPLLRLLASSGGASPGGSSGGAAHSSEALAAAELLEAAVEAEAGRPCPASGSKTVSSSVDDCPTP